MTTYSGRRRARSILVRGGEEVRRAGPPFAYALPRLFLLCLFSPLLLLLRESSSPSSPLLFLVAIFSPACHSTRNASPILRILFPPLPLSRPVPSRQRFSSYALPSSFLFSFATCPSTFASFVFIHPHRSCQTCELSGQTRVPTWKSYGSFIYFIYVCKLFLNDRYRVRSM